MNERTNEQTNGQTERRKLYTPRHKCRGYNYTLSLFLLTFPGSVTYLKLIKPKDLGELCAATSDLANQTVIEKKKKNTKKKHKKKKKTDLLIIHKPNLT